MYGKIQALTDNRKRTAPELRSIFSKNGGELSTTGSVSWIFDTFGYLSLEGFELDDVFESAVGCILMKLDAHFFSLVSVACLLCMWVDNNLRTDVAGIILLNSLKLEPMMLTWMTMRM